MSHGQTQTDSDQGSGEAGKQENRNGILTFLFSCFPAESCSADRICPGLAVAKFSRAHSEKAFGLRPLFLLLTALLLCGSVRAVSEPPEFKVQPGETTPPEETVKMMKLPTGFVAQVFAAEPDIVQPIAFAIDDRGRLWVCENLSYPDWAAEGHDRIVILEDSDGDGHFDKKTVFYDKLNCVSSIELGFGGVFVGSAPHLLFIPDKNGDDIPDGPPEVLLDGWAHDDLHELFNSFNWGPDGWLYGCQGIANHSLVGPPGMAQEARVPINAGVWRYHPTKRKFEAFAHGTSNPWGLDFNDFGQAFITTSVLPHLFHIVQGGLYQRQSGQHFNPRAFEDIPTIAKHRHFAGGDWSKGARIGPNTTENAGGGHAHAGALVYLGDHWPKGARGAILMNNIHGNRVNFDSLTPFGSGYIGDRMPDFLTSGDTWFRGLALKLGPDGSVFICDWYDARACHPQQPHDRTNGRIYKISFGNAKISPFDLAKIRSSDLVKMQLKKNEYFVRHARRILQERGADADAQTELTGMLDDATLDVPQRLRALWALHATGGVSEKTALAQLSSSEPHLAAWTVQLMCEDGPPPLPALLKFASIARQSDSPIVRLSIASAMQRIPIAQRWDVLPAIVSHAEDQDDPNVPLLAWYACEPAVSSDHTRAAAVLAACKIPKVQSFILRVMK